MSHLSCSENKSSKMNNLQLRRFKHVKKKLTNLNILKFSLANSHGILLGKEFHFNLCRPGGLIYGFSLGKDKEKGLRNVLSLS